MNQHIKTPKGVYITLVGGFVLGAVSMAGVFGTGVGIERAIAQREFKPRLMAAPTAESMTELRNLDGSFRALAKFVGPAVVDVRTVTRRAMGPNGERMPMAGGEGSGFIFRPDGYIITNEHVVGNADTVTITLKDGRQFEGKVTRANDISSDIALVKIDAKGLPTLAFADSSKVEPGQFAIAVGAPFGLENSVTVGNVSALGRSNAIGNRVYTDLIQTDAAINMGNSGGPLVNIEGQVIGINTAIYSPTGGSNGIGFAIPSNQAKLVADLLIRNGKITRSMIGVVPQDLKEYQRADMKLPNGGALVTDVVGGPAQSAGLQKGDVIVKIGDEQVRGQIDLRNAMLEYAPGTTVDVQYVRNGKTGKAKVKLEKYQAPRQFANRLPTNPGGEEFPFNPFGEGPIFPNVPGFGDENQGDVPPVRSGSAQLGVTVEDPSPTLRSQFRIPADVAGAVVTNVLPGSVAARLGLRPGDLVQQVGDKAIRTAQDLATAMKGIQWGQTRKLRYLRFGETGQATVNAEVTFR